MSPCAPPPVIANDLIIEILVRLPPDDTACLIRASLVCKPWRRLLSDRAFLRRYLEIHGAPPVVGFFYNNFSMVASTPLTMNTAPAGSPLSELATAGGPSRCRTLDCRHGRVLLNHPGYSVFLTVWDPVSGLQHHISPPMFPLAGAVLCASHVRCDHLDCSSSDGEYVVVVLTKSRIDNGLTRASLFSSASGEWRVSAAIDLGRRTFPGATPSLLAGDTLFFMLGSERVLKYDLTGGVVSVIDAPLYPRQNMILCTAEDGGLGIASVVREGNGNHLLRLVSSRNNADDVIGWAERRVIGLDSVVHDSVGGHLTELPVVGFAEGTGYVFVRANESIFSVDVKTGRISKIGQGSGKFGPIFPFMSFYIPDLASTRLIDDQ